MSSAGAARRRSASRASGPRPTSSSATSTRPPSTGCGAADITYIRTWEGWLYLASVMDCYSRRIVGWALADHLRAELVVDALEMAVARRRPDAGLVHHSDRGSQYTSLIFTRRCRSVGIDVSMGSRGDCFDNAVLESFHASLKKDLIHRRSWPTKAEARTAVFDYIESVLQPPAPPLDARDALDLADDRAPCFRLGWPCAPWIRSFLRLAWKLSITALSSSRRGFPSRCRSRRCGSGMKVAT